MGKLTTAEIRKSSVIWDYLDDWVRMKVQEFIQAILEEEVTELLKPDQNWYGLPAPVYLAKGMLATTRKEWDETEKSFDMAIAINRQYELPWDEAKTLYEWGLTCLARGQEGDREKAGEKLDEALAIFQRIGAQKDVEKVLGKKEMLGA